MGFILPILWIILAASTIPQVALSQTSNGLNSEGLRLVTVTGRAAIIHEDALAEARDMALEPCFLLALALTVSTSLRRTLQTMRNSRPTACSISFRKLCSTGVNS